MQAETQYFVRRASDGTIRTIVARSMRDALKRFTDLYDPPRDGEVYEVKQRGEGDWEPYKIY